MQPTNKALEFELSDLAALWRGKKDSAEADRIVQKYHAVLHRMIEAGFREALDPDSELPNRLMPTPQIVSPEILMKPKTPLKTQRGLGWGGRNYLTLRLNNKPHFADIISQRVTGG